MSNVIETAKAATTAYNDKDWDRERRLFDENGVYDEKGTGRRIQGIGQGHRGVAGLGQGDPRLEGDVPRRACKR